MKRFVVLVTVVAAGLLGTVRPAPAAAWMWVAAPTWSYSAAFASTPTNFAFFWALFTGPTFAHAFAFDRFGSATASAAATPGVGGIGIATVAGSADPFADLSIPGSGSSPFTADIDPHTGMVDGITISDTDMRMAGTDEVTAFLFDGTPCTALGGGVCPASAAEQSSGGTRPTPVASLPLGDRLPLNGIFGPPTELSDVIPFNTEILLSDLSNPIGSPQLVLAADGQAVPEPSSVLILASGIIVLGLGPARARRRS